MIISFVETKPNIREYIKYVTLDTQKVSSTAPVGEIANFPRKIYIHRIKY